jgi:hypothetical protein
MGLMSTVAQFLPRTSLSSRDGDAAKSDSDEPEEWSVESLLEEEHKEMAYIPQGKDVLKDENSMTSHSDQSTIVPSLSASRSPREPPMTSGTDFHYRRRLHEAECEIQELQGGISRRDAEILRLKDVIDSRDDALVGSKEREAYLEKKVQARTSEVQEISRHAIARIKDLKGRIDSSRRRILELSEGYQMQQSQLEQKEQLLSEKEDLLRTRTAELKTAETFLATTDTISGADLTRLVEDLNNEIFQTAAALIDSLPYDATLDNSAWIEDVAETFGQALIAHWHSTVRMGEVDDFDIILQSLLQHRMCDAVFVTITGWMSNGDDSEWFAKFYETIRGTGTGFSL